MTENLRKSIETIRNLSPKLNAATDDAHKTVVAVEKFLNEECSVGLPVRVVLPTPMTISAFGAVDADDGTTTTFLAYERLDGKFRIAVRVLTFELEKDEEGIYQVNSIESIPWVSAPREQKLKTFNLLPELLKVVASESQRMIDSSSETNETMNQILDAMAINRSPHEDSGVSSERDESDPVVADLAMRKASLAAMKQSK